MTSNVIHWRLRRPLTKGECIQRYHQFNQADVARKVKNIRRNGFRLRLLKAA